MSESLPEILWFQFGAALQTLENTIRDCPPEVWSDHTNERQLYWYIAYHTIFWTDYYASETPDETQFRPPAPFTTGEFGTGLPERPYSPAELLDYLAYVQAKVKAFIASLDDEKQRRRFTVPRRDFTYLELTLYNMRHVQHHAAQLNMLLRQRTNQATNWVSRARANLEP